MKRSVFYLLAVGLVLGSGCRKNEDKPSGMASNQDVQTKAPDTKTQIAEKAQEAKTQINETSKAVTEKAGEVARQVSEKTQAAVSNLQVKAEDVMVEMHQSIDELKKKAANFDKTKLQAYADQYKTLIARKQEQIADLTEKIKTLPVKDMMSEKTTAMKKELSRCCNELAALKERCSVYLDKLKELGSDSDDSGKQSAP